jgi:hypothetical protein
VNRPIVCLPLLLLAVLVPPLLAVPEPTPEELNANRLQLEQWQKHPEQLARLRRDLRAFQALPASRRDQILKLDNDLQEDAAATRLVNVLERYVSWIGRLPEKDRRAIEGTENLTARLALIQDLRDQQWMQPQPRAVREKWDTLKGKPRSEYVHKLREEERKRHDEWQVTAHFWKELHDSKAPATRLNELGPVDQEGVSEYLMPMLTAAEQEQLKKAEGHWPGYLMTLVEIADRHPLAFPSTNGPCLIKDLPQAVRQQLQKPWKHEALGMRPVIDNVRSAQADPWPALAAAVVVNNWNYVQKPLPRELWACNFQSLRPPMQAHVTDLKKVLTDKEKERLQAVAGKWPAYPIEIQKLSELHELATPPWETALSGPRERWEAYRTVKDNDMLAVPRQVLEDFALFKLDPGKLAELKQRAPTDHKALMKHLEDEWNKHPEWHASLKMLPRFDPKDKGKGFPLNFGRPKFR